MPPETNILARLSSLESTVAEQEASITTLQVELKAAKDTAAKATAAAIELIRANRKEVYIDIGSLFSWTHYPEPGMWGFDQSHVHDVKAQEAGYLLGIRNGHRSATHVGSYRMFPKVLQEKCDKIKAE